MKHARADYERFQDPLACTKEEWLEIWERGERGEFGSSPIGEDEPVFLVRSQDLAFADTLEAYGSKALELGAEISFVAAVDAHSQVAQRWQQTHMSKVPNMPEVAR